MASIIASGNNLSLNIDFSRSPKESGNGDARRTLKVPMHGGMLERDRGVGWRTGSTRVPLSEETTLGGQGSLRRTRFTRA